MSGALIFWLFSSSIHDWMRYGYFSLLFVTMMLADCAPSS